MVQQLDFATAEKFGKLLQYDFPVVRQLNQYGEQHRLHGRQIESPPQAFEEMCRIAPEIVR